MEVENEIQDIEINLLDIYCYKILYPNQNYKKSIEYQKWKTSIQKIIGSNGIEIFCNKDKIVIYKKNENLEQPIKCPICKRNFYYCKNCKSGQISKNCCSKSLIKKLLSDERLNKYMNLKDNIRERNEYLNYFIALLIPFISNMCIYIYINHILYFGIGKNGNENRNRKFNNSIYKFLQIFFMFGFFISLSLTYMIIHYIFYLSFLIFSLPFKLLPIKLLIGLFIIA